MATKPFVVSEVNASVPQVIGDMNIGARDIGSPRCYIQVPKSLKRNFAMED